MAIPQAKVAATPDAILVTKAFLGAAGKLRLSNKSLAGVIGVSEATISRMRKGEYVFEVGQKPFQLAVLFIRLYRSLDALAAGDDDVSSNWISGPNDALNATPIDMIQSVSGLMNVIGYLDARRAII